MKNEAYKSTVQCNWVAEHPYSNRNDKAYTFKKKKKRIRVITIASSNNRPIDLKKKTL